MKHNVEANSIYVVVESNDLNTNVTLTPCLSYKEAQRYFTASKTNISKMLGAIVPVSKRTMRICFLCA